MIEDLIAARRGIYKNQVDNISALVYKLRSRVLQDNFLDKPAKIALDEDLETVWTKLYSLCKELERL